MNLTNPATGERMTIECFAGAASFADPAGSAGGAGSAEGAGSAGGRSQICFTLPPFQGGPPLHYHRFFDESFEVIEGELEIDIGEKKRRGASRRLRAGESVIVRAGTPHAFRNASAHPVTFRTVVQDGAGFERFIRGWYGAALDGRSGAGGAPRTLLELVTLLDEGDVCLPGAPMFLQRGLRSVLTRVAAWVGARARLAKWW